MTHRTDTLTSTVKRIQLYTMNEVKYRAVVKDM